MSDTSKKRAKRQEARRRAKEKEYRSKLKALRAVGEYIPKGEELTRYRRGRINKAYAPLAQYLEPKGRREFFYVPADKLTRADRAKFLENAKSMEMPTTRRGVFLQKEGQRRATISRTEFEGEPEFRILLTGKVKRGPNKGKRIYDPIPIAPASAMEDARRHIQRQIDLIGPLKKNEQLSFVLVRNEAEIGAHRNTYHSPDAVMKVINGYHPESKSAKLAFLRLVHVRKTTLVEWPKLHPSIRNARKAKRTKPKGYNPH